MKAEIRYELPLDEESAQRMIEKAREIGHPQLLVTLEPEPAGTQRNEAFVLGQSVVEFQREMSALSDAGKFISTELVQ